MIGGSWHESPRYVQYPRRSLLLSVVPALFFLYNLGESPPFSPHVYSPSLSFLLYTALSRLF